MFAPRRAKKAAENASGTAIPFEQCPAKTYKTEQGIQLGRDVLSHCLIVGSIARELMARMPTFMRDLFPAGSELIAASHDVGKVTPIFASKLIKQIADHPYAQHPALQYSKLSLEETYGYHAGASQITLQHLSLSQTIQQIVGQHHGAAPQGILKNINAIGGEVWQQERERLLAQLQQQLGCDWPTVEPTLLSVLSGLTTVADWIGSSSLFDDPAQDWQPQIQQAVDCAGFIAPQIQPDLSFEQIFGFAANACQQQWLELVNAPGLYILEAPMGIGKTEAALFSAYQLLAKGLGSGIYFALPTQLTSNKILDRMNGFLQRILRESCVHRQALLLHANAWLVETEMGEDAAPGGAWFHQGKRGLLAPFGVGTLDQALLSAMNVRHGFVRTFGLAGKVVILDEVHTYDAYTGTLLDALVTQLRQLHCTVIILSATLTQERRQQLLQIQAAAVDYPLITALPDHAPLVEHSLIVPAGQEVQITRVSQREAALEEALYRAETGQQVLWIENTVDEAQRCYLDMAARAMAMNVACGLLHSRFTLQDRQLIENQWVEWFGKAGKSQRALQGRILIGTQILEQSLDIDADFLVSAFAPTDFLLQRIGRLWRHTETVRPESAHCDCWLLVPAETEVAADPWRAFGVTAAVYSPYVLCRSLEVWQSCDALHLPQQIRSLLEQTYCSRAESTDMQRLWMELEEGARDKRGNVRKGRRVLQQLARNALSTAMGTTSDERPQTRYSEQEMCELLLLRRIQMDSEQKQTMLTLLDGTVLALPWQRSALSAKSWRQLSSQLLQQTVHVSIQKAPEALLCLCLERLGLGQCFYLGTGDKALLRVAIVATSGELTDLGHQPFPGAAWRYREDLGLQYIAK